MIIDERSIRRETMADLARQIMIAGRTAPKGKGIDIIEIAVVLDDTIDALSEATRAVGEETGFKFFLRDAENILASDAVILIGSGRKPMMLNCGYCGFATCAQKDRFAHIPCAINMTDLGIAIGSMCAQAADLRVDCRVMFSVGLAAHRMGLLSDCHCVYALPLSASSKNPFFDRSSVR